VAAAIGGIPTSGDQLTLLKLVEQADNVARIQAQRVRERLLARGSALAEQPQSDEMTGAKPPRLQHRLAAATRSTRKVVNQGQRLLNVGRVDAPARDTASELTRLALEDGISTFMVTVTDPRAIVDFAAEVAPRVREAVTQARLAGPGDSAEAASLATVGVGAPAELAAVVAETEVDRTGVTPTPAETTHLSDRAPWDESRRPRRDRLGLTGSYSDAGRRASKDLLDVHNMLRHELSELRDVLRQVRDGAMHAADARGALNEMALRQNDWTLGTICSRYCGVVAAHHSGEDSVLFPNLARRHPQLDAVIDRLTDEHLVIHEAIEQVDHALVQHMTRPEGHDAIQDAIDFLTDALLSHLAYEEHELLEPLARLGFYPGQVPDGAAAAI
jgi:hypothetical protein